MLDIEIYLDILELIHATAGGEGVQVLFRILSGHSEGSELPVNAQIPHPLMAACKAINHTIRGVLRGSHLLAHTRARKRYREGIVCCFRVQALLCNALNSNFGA